MDEEKTHWAIWRRGLELLVGDGKAPPEDTFQHALRVRIEGEYQDQYEVIGEDQDQKDN